MAHRKAFFYIVRCDQRIVVADEDGTTHKVQCQRSAQIQVQKHGGGIATYTLPTLAAQYGMFKAKDTREWFCQNCFQIEQKKFVEAEKKKLAQKEYEESKAGPKYENVREKSVDKIIDQRKAPPVENIN